MQKRNEDRAEHEGEIVAFSMADRADHSIFALFGLPGWEGLGLGGRLGDLAIEWLWQEGAERAWLATGPGTRAERFYARRGWVNVGAGPGNDIRMEHVRPRSGQGGSA